MILQIIWAHFGAKKHKDITLINIRTLVFSISNQMCQYSYLLIESNDLINLHK